MLAGGSICAERTALGKLQLMEYDDLVAVHIVTDAADPITPGTLCRQYMSEVGSASTRVVVDAAKGRIITTLGELYPCPYLYQGVPRHDVISYARTCAQHAQAPASVLEAPEVELLREVCGNTWLQRTCSHVVLCCAVMCCAACSSVCAWVGSGCGCVSARCQERAPPCSLWWRCAVQRRIRGGHVAKQGLGVWLHRRGVHETIAQHRVEG